MKVQNLNIPATYNTPEVTFDAEVGFLELKGKSIPENATMVYEPVINWLKKYITEAPEETNLHINLVYFNTASSIWIAKIIKVLSQIDDLEKLVIIHLYFNIEEFQEMEEEDIKEAIAPATEIIHDARVSMGIKVYGTDDSGKILVERLILI